MILRYLKKKLTLFNGSKDKGIFVPFNSRSSIGGPSTFLKNLRHYFDEVGFSYEKNLNNARVILFPISYDLKALKKFKARGGLVCQRLDGIYYPEKHGQDHLRRNQKIKEIYLNLADHVIFQSEYSRRQCFDMFGEKSPGNYSIIVNGANTDIFYPEYTRAYDSRNIQFCTTGSIRNADMLDPIIKALDFIQEKSDITFKLHVVGPIKDDACANLMKRPYVVHHDNCNLNQVANILRASDIFIYSMLNPPCPNSVIEAISSGLPVVGFKSGAMSELLTFNSELLAEAGNKLYHSLDDLSVDRLAEKMALAVNQYPEYRRLSLDFSNKYSMANCGRQYAEVLQRLITNPTII